MKYSMSFFTLTFGTMVFITGVSGAKQSLYIGALFGLSDHWFEPYAKGFVELFKIAFEEINNRTDILQDYELKLITKDTKMIPGEAAKRLFELVYEEPTKLAIIGPLFSDEAVLVGQITPFYNLIQMNFLAGTSSIKDRQIYKSMYICNFIQDDLNPLRIELMKYFKWSRVATLTFNDEYHKSQIDEFHQMLEKSNGNYTLVTSAIVTDALSVKEHISRFKQYGARIIFGAFRSSKAPYIFCEAYKQGFYGHKYVWILTGRSMYTTWTKTMDASQTSCTREEILTAANGYLTLNNKYLGEENATTFTGMTPEEYNEYMTSYIKSFDYGVSRNTPYGYDAAYALALGLNDSIRYLNGTGLETFNYTNKDVFEAVMKGMDGVDFYGVSGPFSFREGRRFGLSYIEHNIDFKRVTVGMFNPNSGSLTWFDNPRALWSGQSVPKDSFTYRKEYSKRSKVVMSLILVLNVIGMVIAGIFLAFNITFRNNRHIKMSSPRVNNLIIIGTLFMYTSVCLSSYDFGNEDFLSDKTCMVNIWIYAIGFTIVFGALFSKTWRVHVLFRQTDFRKKVIKDSQLFAIVGILVVLDVCILSCWTIVHPLKKQVIEIEREVSDDDVVFTELYSECTHPMGVYWMAVEYVFKGFLLAFGTFLAWETRKVTVPALNDSKLIGFCVYNIVLICAVGVPLQFSLNTEQFMLKYIFISILTIFCTTLILCILFIPKLLLRNSAEKVHFVKSLETNQTQSITASSMNKTATTSDAQSMTVENLDSIKSRSSTSVVPLQNANKQDRKQVFKPKASSSRVNTQSNFNKDEDNPPSSDEVSTIKLPLDGVKCQSSC